MTLQQLEYIMAVYQTGSFTKAAKQCLVTQPTLSAMIQKLEEELQVKIFDRDKQPVVPTAIGKVVLQQARSLLSQASHIQDHIEEERHSLSGIFRIGVLPTIAPYLLPRFFLC
jgi:LysR family hydrogen peroxide-inducible transcriptional activator